MTTKPIRKRLGGFKTSQAQIKEEPARHAICHVTLQIESVGSRCSFQAADRKKL